jgi:hypothetical protein
VTLRPVVLAGHRSGVPLERPPITFAEPGPLQEPQESRSVVGPNVPPGRDVGPQRLLVHEEKAE